MEFQYRRVSILYMHLHFLANCGIFLKKKVNIHIKITSCYAPRHSTNNLEFTSTSYLDLLSTNTSCTESKTKSLPALVISFVHIRSFREGNVFSRICQSLSMFTGLGGFLCGRSHGTLPNSSALFKLFQ